MLTPGRYDGLVIYQGATFDVTFTWRQTAVPPALLGLPVDLTGYTARMQARVAIASTDTLIDLTTENGKLILGGMDGTVRLLLSDVETAALTWSRGVWDLELDSGGDVTRLLYGRIRVSKEVTR